MTDRNPFQTTITSIIMDVAGRRDRKGELAVHRFVQIYGPPIAHHLSRRFGFQEEEAVDILNEFMIAKILEPGPDNNLAARYLDRRQEGRPVSFRGYLLRAVINFTLDKIRRRDTLQLEAIDYCDPVAVELEPTDEFEAEWAANILNEAIRSIEDECAARGQVDHWRVFHARVLEPFFLGRQQPELNEVARQLSLKDAKVAANMLVTVRSKFRKKVRELVKDYLPCSPSGDCEIVVEELQDLRRIASSIRYTVKIADQESSEPLSLWDVAAGQDDILTDRDRRQLWEELLDKRVEEFIYEIAPHLATTFADVSVWGGHSLNVMADLWSHPSPPEMLLQEIKIFAKAQGRMEGGKGHFPREICVALYHASIAAAWVRLETRITRDKPSTVLKRLSLVLSYGWLDPVTRNLIETYEAQLREVSDE